MGEDNVMMMWRWKKCSLAWFLELRGGRLVESEETMMEKAWCESGYWLGC